MKHELNKINKARMKKQIDVRKIDGQELKDFINERMEENKQETINILHAQLDEFKITLRQTADDIFRNATFVKRLERHLKEYINAEVNATIKAYDLKKAMGDMIKADLKENMQESIYTVTTSIVHSINKKLSSDYERTKKLCYSIDAEVRHTMMHLPVSSETDKLVQSKIKEILQEQKTAITAGQEKAYTKMLE